MLLTLITFAAMMLFGGWMFGAIAPNTRDRKKSSQSPILANKKISLYSLIYLLFFYQLPSPEHSQKSFINF
jgi:hypothetical protein